MVVPPPADGPCSKADLVLLRALIKGTGRLDTLVCLFVGDNAVNASNQPGGNCPGALIAVPITPLVGVCVLVPPAGGMNPAVGLPAVPAVPGVPAVPALPDAGAATGLVAQIVATLNELVVGGLPALGS